MLIYGRTLDNDIQQLLFAIKVRRQIVSRTMDDLLIETHAVNQHALTMGVPTHSSTHLQHGAIPTNGGIDR